MNSESYRAPIMTRLLPLCMLLAFQPGIATAVELPPFAVAERPVAVSNRPDLDAALANRDGCGQLRALEFIALPGTVFRVTGSTADAGRTVYRVTTDDYPYPSTGGYYLAAAAVRPEKSEPPPRRPHLPPRDVILAALERRVGTGYVWGGNVAEGVVPVAGGRSILAGLDCSGLLYEATGGFTPRNTSSLVSYGNSVAVVGKSAAAIAAVLRPLDLIVWPGHVLIVIDGGKVIESRLVCGKPAEGVRIRPLSTALEEIMKTRRPVDRLNREGKGKEFVVRRWYAEFRNP